MDQFTFDLRALDDIDFAKVPKRNGGAFPTFKPSSGREVDALKTALNIAAKVDKRAQTCLDVLRVGEAPPTVIVNAPAAVAIGANPPVPGVIKVPFTLALGMQMDLAVIGGGGAGMGLYGGAYPKQLGLYVNVGYGGYTMIGFAGAVVLTYLFRPPSDFAGTSVTGSFTVELAKPMGVAAGLGAGLVFADKIPIELIGIVIIGTAGLAMGPPLSLSLTKSSTALAPFLVSS